MPEIKVLTPEEITAKLNEVYDELWAKYDEANSGSIDPDDLKKLAADVKGRVNGNDVPIDVEEAGFAEAEATLAKNDDDKYEKKDVKTMLDIRFSSL